ncbi:MAG: phosphonoacetaldehyde hydrolase [Syntrophobacteraceae bacterium]|jgi:phosphonoacetaldehyde hydrolase|nr:phosphonoacetaldehyde hydrolase [Syntrophobacteraceae bacterium]
MEAPVRRRLYTGPVRAVILDWAGTAVDFGCMGPVGAFIEVLHGEGVRITAAEARQSMGLRKIDHLRALCGMESIRERWKASRGREIDEGDIQRMYGRLEPLMIETIAGHSDPVPGLMEFLSRCRGRNIRIGSTTGYTRPIMEVLMEQAARKGYRPDCVVTSSDVPEGRPSPFMCYRNAIELEVYPMEAMVKIGDTVSDIQEGLNAGMWTIALTLSGSELGLSGEELASLRTDEVQGRIDAIATRFRTEGAHYVAPDIGHCWTVLEEIEARLSSGERP